MNILVYECGISAVGGLAAAEAGASVTIGEPARRDCIGIE